MDVGWLGNLPKLTSAMLRQNLPVTFATAMAYLDQHRPNHQSTKPRKGKGKQQAQAALSAAATVAMDELPHIIDEETDPNLCFQVLAVDELVKSSDATGKFPFTTLSGWNYILVSTMKGYVHFELLRSRMTPEYKRACQAMYAFYAKLNKTPTTQRLDNESSALLEEFLAGAQGGHTVCSAWYTQS
jgi:hypothetical protein